MTSTSMLVNRAFVANLAVRRAKELRYRLGIMVDTEAYYECDSLLERDLLRPLLLRNFGWIVVMVLIKDWLARHNRLGLRVMTPRGLTALRWLLHAP
jgi:hypothetical protein